KEIMEIISGEIEVLMEGSEGWKTVKDGEVFEVPAKSRFSFQFCIKDK
ncbi:MAG: DUF1255 family protein, partial [Desulfamplus sp.]|nr:DUF1255 family protein [Desulfamplus sp.]